MPDGAIVAERHKTNQGHHNYAEECKGTVHLPLALGAIRVRNPPLSGKITIWLLRVYLRCSPPPPTPGHPGNVDVLGCRQPGRNGAANARPDADILPIAEA
jgi:hypothetical protein